MAPGSKRQREEQDTAVIRKVARRQEAAGHGGAWKVAFADFVLALMCLFLVMWLMAARDQENLQQLLRASGGSPLADGAASRIRHDGNPRGSLIPREPVPGQPQAPAARSQLRDSNHPSALGGEPRQLDSMAELQQLAASLARLSAASGLAGNLQAVVTPDGLRVMLHDTEQQGMFARGSAVINDRFRRLLQQMGALFAGIDNQLLLVGHTDSAQYRGQEFAAFSNWSLSSNRAMAARAHLLHGGMPAASVLQVAGMADRAPLDAANPAAARNRRIELLVLTSGQARQLATMFGMPPPDAAASGKSIAVDEMATLFDNKASRR